jgi:hypothetical protein
LAQPAAAPNPLCSHCRGSDRSSLKTEFFTDDDRDDRWADEESVEAGFRFCGPLSASGSAAPHPTGMMMVKYLHHTCMIDPLFDVARRTGSVAPFPEGVSRRPGDVSGVPVAVLPVDVSRFQAFSVAREKHLVEQGFP